MSLAQIAYQLANEKRVWLPTMDKVETTELPITTVETIGEIGPYHADIDGITSDGGIRGPFEVSQATTKGASTYPVLWSHDASNERTMLFDADSEGSPRRGSTTKEQASVDLKVKSIWKSASHCHFNQNFRFNSQSTGMQFTPRRTIGGRAWLSIRLPTIEHEKALVLWANTSLGLLLHWWHSNKQQPGRGNIGKSALQNLPILDVTTLTSSQLTEAVNLFEAMSGQWLLPMHQIEQDAVRKELDEKFAQNVLGLAAPIIAPGGPLEILRMKLSREPSIRGQKHT